MAAEYQSCAGFEVGSETYRGFDPVKQERYRLGKRRFILLKIDRPNDSGDTLLQIRTSGGDLRDQRIIQQLH